jgi:hypothetical protein
MNMDSWLSTLLIWTLLVTGPIPLAQSLSLHSIGKRHDP